jgi:hypothetical protein
MTDHDAAHKADKYISIGGRGPNYGRSDFSRDLICVASFLVWAEDSNEFFGGERAGDAYQSMMRLLDMDPIKLRKIVKGDHK